MRASYILIIVNERVKVKENLKFVSFLSQYLRTVLRQSLIFCDKSVKLKYGILSLISAGNGGKAKFEPTERRNVSGDPPHAALAKTGDLWYNKTNY